jgi:bacterioferritin-associated ferredoxin
MYVCVCNAVTDREIVERVHAGADTIEAIRFELGVATCCGQCSDCAQAVIDDALRARSAGHAAAEPVSMVAVEVHRARVLIA